MPSDSTKIPTGLAKSEDPSGTNVPYGTLYGNELHFIYQIPTGRDKSEVFEDFKRNLENIKKWLVNTEEMYQHLMRTLKETLTI